MKKPKIIDMDEKELVTYIKKFYEKQLIEFDDSQESINKLLDEIQKQNNNIINDFKNSHYL